MSNVGTLLLSKVIEDGDVSVLSKFNVKPTHFTSETDRKVFDFIQEYSRQNDGQCPSYATVVDNVSDFYFIPDVSDSYKYLQRQLYAESGTRDFIDFVSGGGLQALYDQNKGDIRSLIGQTIEKLAEIEDAASVREKVGVSVKDDTGQFLLEYERRKDGKSFKTWKSSFSIIGEYTSGNMYVIYGKSGRGKSVIATVVETLTMALQGATVLIWSMEMTWFEVFVRLYAGISAHKGMTKVNVGGMDLTGGFDSNSIRNGKLSEEFEESFRQFLETINDEIPGNIIVRGVDDSDFTDRSLRQLESDVRATNADVVVVDPAYYLDYEKNTSRTAGGDAAETSKKLRRLTGSLQVVTIAITQAEETKESKDDDGARELQLPEREHVKKTKALLEDAAMLIAVDTDYQQCRGLIGINKGRNGGEGEIVEIIYVPQVGIVRELETGGGSIENFDF